MTKFYDIKARANKTAEISIYGQIGESFWSDESVSARQYVKDLAALDATAITLHMHTIGGSVNDGLAIYNANQRHPAAINVVIDGIALSIGSLIAMSGDTVEMAENALLMIHAPSAMAGGQADDLRSAADALDKYRDAMAVGYIAKTGAPDKVAAWLADGGDHWFSAAEALDEGLIDTVTAAKPVTAKFDLSNFKSMPAAAGIFNQPPNREKPMAAIEPNTPTAASDPLPATPTVIPTAAVPQPSEAEIKLKVLAAENQRRNDIKARFAPLAAKFPAAGLESVMAACLDDHTVDVQAAVEQLMNKLGENTTPTAGKYASRVETGETDAEKFARGVGQAIMARAGKEKHDPANEFRGMRLEDVARECLARSGFKVTAMDRLSLAKQALGMRPTASYGQTTSDFPVLLENVMHRMVLTAYNATPDTWRLFCVTGSVSDFREWQRLRVGSIADIEDVNEAGEYKHRNIPDAAKEGITAKRRGNIISITPEVIINDDIGYIATLTTNMGRAAKRTIENKVYALIAANPTMKDGHALFSTEHANLAGAGTVPSVDSLDLARIAMAKQKDIGGDEYLDIRPSIWLGGLTKGGDVRVIVGAQYDPDTVNKLQRPNKVNGIVQNIIDTPRIAGNDWYLFGDPTVAPVIEVVFLDGQSEPLLAMEEQFNTAGLSYRVELPFGVGAIGYEGAYKNPGA
jgi:ATP-dependent protease ClpP protease subunit